MMSTFQLELGLETFHCGLVDAQMHDINSIDVDNQKAESETNNLVSLYISKISHRTLLFGIINTEMFILWVY